MEDHRVHRLLGDGVANDVLQEDLEHATRLLCATRGHADERSAAIEGTSTEVHTDWNGMSAP